VAERAIVVTAALARGVGWRTATERSDLLMQDAAEDMFAEALTRVGDRKGEVEAVVATLHEPLHPNCYLSPTQFAEQFGLTRNPNPALHPDDSKSEAITETNLIAAKAMHTSVQRSVTPISATANVPPTSAPAQTVRRRKSQAFILGLILLLVLAAIAGLFFVAHIDIMEIFQQFARATTRVRIARRGTVPVVARLCRLGRCSKSSAIPGTPVMMPTSSRRQPVTQSRSLMYWRTAPIGALRGSEPITESECTRKLEKDRR
jgi:hypothetical protein